MAPVVASLSVDRLPFEQYTDPPGDLGLFGPGSATWRVHGDPSMLIGGLCRLLLRPSTRSPWPGWPSLHTTARTRWAACPAPARS